MKKVRRENLNLEMGMGQLPRPWSIICPAMVSCGPGDLGLRAICTKGPPLDKTIVVQAVDDAAGIGGLAEEDPRLHPQLFQLLGIVAHH